VFLIGIQIGYTQNFSPIFHNISDKLPSSEVHNIYQDSIGYIWYATDRGITRYDGQNFLTPNTEQYFTSSVFNFFEENKHKVWISTGENELFWFNPADNTFKMHPYIYNDVLVETIKSKHNKTFIRQIYLSKNDCKVTFLKKSGYVEVKNGKGIKINTHYSKQSYKQSDLHIKIENSFIYSKFHNNTNTMGGLYLSIDGKDILIDPVFNYSTHIMYGISSIVKQKNTTYLSIGQYLIKVKDSKISFKKLPSEILRIHTQKKLLLIGTFKGVYQLNSKLETMNFFLENSTITDIKKDIDNGYWFSTTDNGVYHTIDLSFLELKNSQEIKPSYIFTKNNYFYALQKNNKLYAYTKQGRQVDVFSRVHEHQGVLSTSERKLDRHLEHPIAFNSITNFFSYNTDNKINFSNYNKNGTIINKKRNVFIPKIENSTEVIDRKLLNDSTLIVATKNKMYSYHIKKEIYTELSIPSEEMIMFETISNTILIQYKNGTYTYKNGKLKLLPINSKFNKLHIQNDTTFWTYGYNGLHKIIYNDSMVKSDWITKDNGLPTNEIISLTTDKNHIWIGSKKGIIKLNTNYKPIRKTLKKENFIIDSIHVNRKRDNNNNNSQRLKTGEKSTITIYFKYIQFTTPHPIQFEYQINNSAWLSCNTNNIILQNLNSGLQTIKIRKYNAPLQTILFKKSIEVTPPYYKKTWFIILISLVSIFIFYYLAYRINIYKNKKKESRFHTLQLELKLLTSQMNPHFTFNTINSIQYYILKNEKKEAIQYLSDFALLMRKTLDFSMNDQVNIKEELDYIELYIALENKRFDKNFIFEKHVQDSISANSDKIPSLLIQPLIENIILHANYSKTQDKKIILSIIKNENYYILKIIDFGVGIYSNNNLEKHKSYGIDILKNRLKIYNRKNYSPSDIQFKFTDEINKTGTSVIIKLYINESNYN